MSDAGQHGGDTPKKYTDEELDAMSRDDLVKLGTNLDGVDVVYRRDRWSVKGTRRKSAPSATSPSGSASPAFRRSRSSRSTCSGPGSTQRR